MLELRGGVLDGRADRRGRRRSDSPRCRRASELLRPARQRPRRAASGLRRTCSPQSRAASSSRSTRSDSRRRRRRLGAAPSRSHIRKERPIMAMTKDQLIDEIKGMSVLDLAELVKALEEEFGVSAAAARRSPRPHAAGGGGGGAAAAEEQTEFDVDPRTPPATRRSRSSRSSARSTGLGLKEAKDRRRRGPQGRQGGRHPRGGRQDQGRARGGWRERRGQVAHSAPWRIATGRPHGRPVVVSAARPVPSIRPSTLT